MSRVRCPLCSTVLAASRGFDRMRFVPLKVFVVRAGRDGTQALETVCPGCSRDVTIPLPLPGIGTSLDALKAAAADLP